MNMHEECLKRQNEGYHTPLPEVIKRIERDSQKLKQRFAPLDIQDAIYYLKEYQACGEDLIRNCDRHVELYNQYRNMIDESEKNDPLTWDELREMEGKPVWIEELGKKYAISSWFIHNGTADGYDNDEILYLQPFATFTKHTLGKTWQAYRKERS